MLQRQKKRFSSHLLLLIFIIASAFLYFILVSSASSEENPHKTTPQVLIVHSAYQGYPWTDSLNRGIKNAFENSHEAVDIIYEYLDTKRNTDESYFIALHKLWQKKYDKRRIDIILACDSQAYDFVIKGRPTLFTDVPIVFAAYIGFTPQMLAGKNKITGVVQETDIRQTIDIALQLHPRTKKIIFIAPGAPKWRMKWLVGIPEQYEGDVQIETVTDGYLNDINKVIQSIDSESVVIPLNSAKYRDDTYMPFDLFVSHLSNSGTYPVYGLWDIALNKGAVGGKMVSGERQGSEGANLVLKLIRGTPIEDIPVIDQSPNQYMFDYNQLDRFNVNMKNLPQDSYIINVPSSLYSKNKAMFLAIVLCFVILISLIMLLLSAVFNLKKTKSKLLLSDEILKQMPEAIIVTDPNGKITRWLGNAEEIFGYCEYDCKGQSIDFFQSKTLGLSDDPEILKSLTENGQYKAELICHKKNGTVIPTDVSATQVVDKVGNIVANISIFKDITERKNSERALVKSQSRFAKMIQKSPLPMLIVNVDQGVDFLNDKFTELFGYTKEDIVTAEDWWTNVYPDPEYAKKVRLSWEAATIYATENNTDVEMQEWNLTRKDRSTRRCEFYMVPLDSVFLVVMNDITDRIQAEAEKDKLESRLQQAQKMEAIGTLAGGIAHDFNNLLSVIIGFTELAKDSCESDSHIAKDLHEVLQAGDRAKELVQQILAFSRKNETESFALQPANIAIDIIKILRPSLPTTIDIVQNIDKHTGLILANPTQIHQILMNLCTNAYHAMEQSGGKLHITLREVLLTDEDLIHVPDVQSGPFIQFEIQDTGKGVSPEIKDKIFDPYFTTKETGKGTGMGLAIVHGIVKNNGGFISFFSKVGVGTTFYVFWPVIVDDTHRSAIFEEVSIPSGNETILFVDDEVSLAKMGKFMLESLGYSVVTKSNSTAALSEFENNPEKYDLVITDQTMPELTGLEMSRKMLEIDPNIPIILCTGYSTIITESIVKNIGIKEFALKPLTKRHLGLLVRKTLDNRNNGENFHHRNRDKSV